MKLAEYLTRRETAQTVPASQALSAHPEIPDTVQTKPLVVTGESALRRAQRLGHRLV